jgi:hypothetical protein
MGDQRAAGALAEAESSNLTIGFANRGLLGYTRAVLAGRAGDRARAAELLDAAETADRRAPTYYGGAWVALGRAFLDGGLRSDCGRGG